MQENIFKNKYIDEQHELILTWLKNRKNYISFQNSNVLGNCRNQLKNLLIASRIHHDDLEASEYYFIERKNILNQKILEVNRQFPNNHQYKFKNYNMPINQYLHYFEHMKILARCFDSFDLHTKIFNIKLILIRVRKELKQKNRIIKEKILKYNDIFPFNPTTQPSVKKPEDKNIILQYIKQIRKNLKAGECDFGYFKDKYIDFMAKTTDNIEEVGVFYPFKLDNDIFENRFYLLEFNPIRFTRQNNVNFIKIVRDFYKKYKINHPGSMENLTLEEYFTTPGDIYEESFAYFNPFKFVRKYSQEFQYLIDYVKNNGINHKLFYFDFFNFLNQTQYKSVVTQHENLLRNINLYRSKNRQISPKEFLSRTIKDLTEMLFGDEYKKYNFTEDKLQYLHGHRRMLIIFEEKYNKLSKKPKDIVIDDLFPADNPLYETFRLFGNEVLSEIKEYLGTNQLTLQDMLEAYILESKTITDNYSLDKKCEKLILDAIYDIILFYGDREKEKMSKYFNNTINNLYVKYQKTNLKNIINVDYAKEFERENIHEFNFLYSTQKKKTSLEVYCRFDI